MQERFLQEIAKRFKLFAISSVPSKKTSINDPLGFCKKDMLNRNEVDLLGWSINWKSRLRRIVELLGWSNCWGSRPSGTQSIAVLSALRSCGICDLILIFRRNFELRADYCQKTIRLKITAVSWNITFAHDKINDRSLETGCSMFSPLNFHWC
uniref:Uncharacterized protein n=1 Tax=Romanomermis culicivorax TaxID=13658 RepID=A0A915JMJ6_ROMCU